MDRSTDGWAHRRESDRIGTWYSDFGSKRWVKLHGLKHPIVAVTVREAKPDETPRQWAWWGNGDGKFRWLWASRIQVAICFPYGPEAEEARGRGKLLGVVVEEREVPDESS